MAKERITFEAFLEDNMSDGFGEIEREGKKAFQRIDKEIDETHRGMVSLDMSTEKLIKRFAGIAGGYLAFDKIGDFAKHITQATAKYQQFEAVLSNTLGNTGEAREAFDKIENFAAKTPFQLDELTGSFVNLASQGFEPTMKQMTNLGDLAASKGKSFNQLTEALIDAEVGEFERLKAFGIRASKEGDKVTFTFKGQQKQVDFTNESIRKYILSLGKMQGVTGAMAKISETTGGKISNLRDNIDTLAANVGDKYKGQIDGAIETTGRFVSILNDYVEVPASEKLMEERIEVNLLASELVNAETPLDRRNAIYAKLQEIAPKVIEGIEAENVNTIKLRENIAAYNVDIMKNIVLLQRQEEVRKLQNSGKAERAAKGQITSEREINTKLRETADIANARGDKELSTELSNVLISGLSAPEKAAKAEDLLTNEDDIYTGKKAGKSGKGFNYVAFMNMAANSYERNTNKLLDIGEQVAAIQAEIDASIDVENPKKKIVIPGNTEDDEEETGDKVSQALAGISGDNRQVKNISINIEKLGGMEDVRISSENPDEDLEEFADKMRSVLMTVVNDANLLAD